ncbi:inositol 1,4,5-trisphosphate receptor-interacting protein [Triplophysa rosa]|uniref:Inositol 1,4,5-trisphosphate receptor-interacting protein n=1 Tax=Triplophysa rosa TaxID=992332 RepID=A0A9W7WNJ1_TRIRA|nr:inositol 1,4,5-trisphosphate receptor-interacting protein [Triplophysa rosa]KAI7805506.1 inositol 1 [Triplophysa rosa]
MQGAIARVCVVVAAAILNHPLLFPNENTTIPEQDDALLARMREHQENLEAEQKRLEQEIYKTEKALISVEDSESYSWYFWSALCLVIFFTIEVCRQDIVPAEIPDPVEDEDGYFSAGYLSANAITLDKGVLNNFCKTRFHSYAHENGRVQEFVEGFADDLLEALKSVCDGEADMEVEDFVGIGSMFESWRVCKPLACDLIVPFTAPQPYRFQFDVWCDSVTDIPLDLQGCVRIKLIQPNGKNCVCGAANLGDDMLCLLHNINDFEKTDEHGFEEVFCVRDNAYLSKAQIMRWFQISITRAWRHISHKYEFELAFQNLDVPGALKIRFRSGKTVVLNVTPAVQFENTDAYFISHFPSETSNPSDTHWHLSLTVYERNLLKHLAKKLPTNSCHIHCLQIVSFLHKKQTALTGKSALTNYHVKTAVLHLLLSKPHSVWQTQHLDHRLQDLLSFLQKSVEEKRLYHAIVGNPRVPVEIQIPELFRSAEPINLFRPLVLQRQVYAKMVDHFQEMIRNTSVLVQEYTPHFPNGHMGHKLSSATHM